jgi:hypothetical protein
VWKRTVKGKILHFHLAGINNQNFIMRDEETGSFWQQVSGAAIAGAMKGAQLELVPFEELSFALWKQENPGGLVLEPDTKFARDYAPKNWEDEIDRLKTPELSTGNIPARELMVGISLNGAARAYPFSRVRKESPIMDSVGSEPVLIALGPDNQSVRVFRAELPGTHEKTEFFRASDAQHWELLDSASSSHWNFEGCAISGPQTGNCLDRVTYLKDFWFDWHNYHPHTTAYLH